MKTIALIRSLLSTFALAFLATGCIESPLLNHADAAQQQQQLNSGEGCQFHLIKSQLCAAIEWKTFPARPVKGAFTVRFWDDRMGTSTKGPYVDPGHAIFFEPFMTSMGHGNPRPWVIAPAVDADGIAIPGVYEVTSVYFVMEGDWEVRLQLLQDGLKIDEAKIDLSIAE